MQKIELLAPAGNFQKLKTAFYYGADAVYLGGKGFSLRSFADNFTHDELKEGIVYAHARGKKVYVCANVFARNTDFPALGDYFEYLREIGADGVLVSDLGALATLRKRAPELSAHISTQANVTNKEAVAAYAELGASRVVLARELSIAEIEEIHEANPQVELEAFVHGAMCVSYSGRCLLSDYLDGRSSNRGACAQPCRYEYEIRAKGRESEGWLPISEDGRGTYFLNSKDLNMSGHLSELAAAGVSSFKIEGRMKSEYYLATVVNAYRRILSGADAKAMQSELTASAHRAYTTAYALGKNTETVARDNSQTKGTCEFIGIVRGCSEGRVSVEMRSRFLEGETLEVLSPSEHFAKSFPVREMKDALGAPCADAKRVQELYTLACPYPLAEGDILRRRR